MTVVDPNIEIAYQELINGKYLYILTAVEKNYKTYDLIKTGDRNATFSDFISELKPDKSLIAIYYYHFNVEIDRKIEQKSQILHISWVPYLDSIKSKIGNRMSMLTCLCQNLPRIKVVTHQACDFEEISEEVVLKMVKQTLNL